MENTVINSETAAEVTEKDEAVISTAVGEKTDGQVFVPVKVNNEIRNLELEKVSQLAGEGLKFEAIANDYENLKRLANEDGRSVSEFLIALENSRRELRKKELTEKCGGDEEMAEYVLGLEDGGRDGIGFEELKTEFPDIKDISDLPESVVENAKLRGTLLLDEYLRYRHSAEKEAAKAKAGRIAADNMSVGSQTDRRGGINPETAEFIKGLWR